MDTTQAQPASPARPSILTETQVIQRMRALGELKTALAAEGIPATLARTRRLVLRGRAGGEYVPSGPTDPRLYVFAPDQSCVVTTDGSAYCIAGERHPASDLAAVAASIRARAVPALA